MPGEDRGLVVLALAVLAADRLVPAIQVLEAARAAWVQIAVVVAVWEAALPAAETASETAACRRIPDRTPGVAAPSAAVRG